MLLPTSRAAAVCLAVLLMAMFPANVRTAREHLMIGKLAATALPLRNVLHIVFIAEVVVAGFPSAFRIR